MTKEEYLRLRDAIERDYKEDLIALERVFRKFSLSMNGDEARMLNKAETVRDAIDTFTDSFRNIDIIRFLKQRYPSIDIDTTYVSNVLAKLREENVVEAVERENRRLGYVYRKKLADECFADSI